MRQRPGYRNAFTLVELLVVIAIIGVLMALLLPAVQSARESGRRLTCTNNQYQMAFAAIRFNDTNNFLPGWRNQIPGTSTSPSWPVMLLPFLERTDVFRAWSSGNFSTPFLTIFVCPSSPPDTLTGPVLAYAGNCGTANSVKANGIMVDTVTPAFRLSLDEVSGQDGTSMTLILSEKCISGTAGLVSSQWSTTLATGTTFSFAGGSSAVPGFGIVGTGTVPRIINNAALGPPGQASQPSSNHPGGAVAAFCDGRTFFLKDSLAQSVYGRLITSDGITANTISGNAAANSVWSGITPPAPPPSLSEGDYQ